MALIAPVPLACLVLGWLGDARDIARARAAQARGRCCCAFLIGLAINTPTLFDAAHRRLDAPFAFLTHPRNSHIRPSHGHPRHHPMSPLEWRCTPQTISNSPPRARRHLGCDTTPGTKLADSHPPTALRLRTVPHPERQHGSWGGDSPDPSFDQRLTMNPTPSTADATATESGQASRPNGAAQAPMIGRIGLGAPLRWLARGAADFRAHPLPCLFYGLCFAAMGWLLGALLRPAPGLMMAMTGGFLLVGPFMAMGLYEVARCNELDLPCRLASTTVAWSRNFGNIALFGIGQGVVLAIWARASMMVLALALPRSMPNMTVLLDTFTRGENLGFVLSWLGVGALFAMLVFALSIVAIPMMLDRGTDAITAMITSARAVGSNTAPLALWAALIVALAGVGFASLFLGLIVTIPWIGLASWHAYRDLLPVADVAPEPSTAVL